MSARMAASLGLIVALVATAASADQYRTKIREVPESEAETPSETDLEQQLEQMDDNPYGKSMTLRHLASKAATNGNMGEARRYLEQAVDLEALAEPAMDSMRGDLAQLHAAAGRHEQVIATLAPVLQRGADADALPAKAWLALGNAYAKQGQWDKAVEPMQRAAAASTGGRDEGLYRLQVAVFMRAQQYAKAEQALQRLIEIAPQKKTYWMQLAAVNSQRGDHRGAMAALEIAHRRGMLETPAERLQLVRALLDSGAPYDAAAQLARWIESGDVPANGQNYRLLAAAWTEAEEFGRAVGPLETAANRLGDAKLYAQLGQLHVDLANWNKAAEAFQRALGRGGLGGRTGEVLMSLGLAYYQLDRTDAAFGAFQRAKQYGNVARVASQWVDFLEAKPAGLQPLKIQGLAGAAPEGEAETELASASGAAAARETAAAPLPDSVPDTGDPWRPIGAVRAGNADGTIPPWRGGLTPDTFPGEYEPGKRIENPYPNESPRFVITSQNYKQYADRLSAGHRALFEKYPDYRMPVYPTHRSAAYPEAIYKATLANEKRARLENPDSLVGARLGYPFRKPENGVEVMWNHRVRYRSNDIWVRSDEAVVRPDGDRSVHRRVEEVLFGYGNLSKPSGMEENIIAYYIAYLNRNGRREGTVLAHETLDQRRGERRIWVSVPGTGRLVRLPPVGYDNPRPSTDGLMFVDQLDMYNGAFDKYVWRLVGRKEMFVPYNAYGMLSADVSYDELLKPRHPDQSHARYERHRVWVVEATERGGEEHKFGTRVFYVDEDSWSILMVDNYDDSGRVWRFQEGHASQYYDLRLTYTSPVFIYDLRDGRYLATRLTNEAPPIFYNTGKFEPVDFMPATVRRRTR